MLIHNMDRSFLTLLVEQPFASIFYIVMTIILTPIIWFQEMTQFPGDIIFFMLLLFLAYIFCRVNDVRIVVGGR
jgi:hypothetical protein